jgi:polysaccharide deacetylase 2 family uncharacterized protein YibQ
LEQHDKGALPETSDAAAGSKYQDPFLDAIARNPRPLIMVLIGLIGMPLMIWLASPSPRNHEPAPSPPEVPAYESSEAILPAETRLPETAGPDGLGLNTPPPPADTVPTAPADQVDVPNQRAETHAYIALIIDDIGYSEALGARAIALPGAVTYAVLPHTPYGVELAAAAHRNNKELMLHAPMSNLADIPLGPGGLTMELSQEEFMQTLFTALDSIPNLRGLNNHMGSALTEQETPMRWVMAALKERNLYFVDSYTTARSVAGHIAKEVQIPTLTRNVFLDNEADFDNIDREFKRLLVLAKERGSAVGIGHPYEATLAYLEQAIPALAAENIELISVSSMLEQQREAAAKDAL